MKRWRIAENEWNLRGAPWKGAVGIEEIDDDLAVPALICWFTRGWTESDKLTEAHPAVIIVRQHNQELAQ